MSPKKMRTVRQRSSKKMSRLHHLSLLSTRRRLEKESQSAESLTPPLTPPPSSSSFSEQAPISASKRKLSLFSHPSSSSPVPSSSSPVYETYLPTTFIDLATLRPLLNGLLCPDCKCDSLSIHGNRARSVGFAVHLEVWCSECSSVINSSFTSPRISGAQAFEVSRKVVSSSLATGMGHASLQKFSEFMGMLGMHINTFGQHMDLVFNKAKSHALTLLSDSREKVVNYYRGNHPDSFAPDGMLEIAVSYDGTWGKRGHTSKVGCGAVIDVMTGLVIDFHVMSLHCQFCTPYREKNDDNGMLPDHCQSDQCTKNYDGSSGGMEVEGALVMWRRSENHGMRYIQMVSDGDAKTFLALTKDKPYDCATTKEECVNHVAKRLNTSLRNLVTNCKREAVTLGGRSKGSLTQAKIGLLQTFYIRAVQANSGSLDAMHRAIWASLKHSTASPDSPRMEDHSDCPTCPDSWCSYQRDVFMDRPPSKRKEQSTYLNEKVAAKVHHVYERLTDRSLLSRCLLGKTQNTNESLQCHLVEMSEASIYGIQESVHCLHVGNW